MDYNVIEIANGYLLEPINNYNPEYLYNFMYFATHDTLAEYVKDMIESAG